MKDTKDFSGVDYSGTFNTPAAANRFFWARITDYDGSLFYAWQEVSLLPVGGKPSYVNKDAGRKGSLAGSPALEPNGKVVAVGTLVLLRKAYFDPELDWVYAICYGSEGGGGTGGSMTVQDFYGQVSFPNITELSFGEPYIRKSRTTANEVDIGFSGCKIISSATSRIGVPSDPTLGASTAATVPFAGPYNGTAVPFDILAQQGNAQPNGQGPPGSFSYTLYPSSELILLVPRAGLYLVGCNVHWTWATSFPLTAGTYRAIIRWQPNGSVGFSSIAKEDTYSYGAKDSLFQSFHHPVYLNKSDQVKLALTQNSGTQAAALTSGGESFGTSISLVLIGPDKFPSNFGNR